MSKVFSVVELSLPNDETVCESFIVPGIPRDEIENDGVCIDQPSEYGRTPDDFAYDRMYTAPEIHVLYTAYCYGSGQTESPDNEEMLALAIIFHDGGDIAEAFGQVLDMVESGHFTCENPFYVEDDPEDEEDEE